MHREVRIGSINLYIIKIINKNACLFPASFFFYYRKYSYFSFYLFTNHLFFISHIFIFLLAYDYTQMTKRHSTKTFSRQNHIPRKGSFTRPPQRKIYVPIQTLFTIEIPSKMPLLNALNIKILLEA